MYLYDSYIVQIIQFLFKSSSSSIAVFLPYGTKAGDEFKTSFDESLFHVTLKKSMRLWSLPSKSIYVSEKKINQFDYKDKTKEGSFFFIL